MNRSSEVGLSVLTAYAFVVCACLSSKDGNGAAAFSTTCGMTISDRITVRMSPDMIARIDEGSAFGLTILAARKL